MIADLIRRGRQWRGTRRPNLIGEFVVMFLLIKVYDWIRGFAALRRQAAWRHGRDELSFEHHLGIDLEHAVNQWLAGHATLSTSAVWYYGLSHISVTLAVLTWCYVRNPELYRPARNALVATNVVGMAVFMVLPVMPPRLLPGGQFVDSVLAAGLSTTDGPVTADQYAAMPSLHLAWATWAAIVALALLGAGRLRWLCMLYPACTAVDVVATGNHYLLDVLAGVVVAVLAGYLTGVRAHPAGPPPLAHLMRLTPLRTRRARAHGGAGVGATSGGQVPSGSKAEAEPVETGR